MVFIIHNLSVEITNKLIEKRIIVEETDIYCYGLELVLSSSICTVLSLMTGFILHKGLATLLFLLLFILLRFITGGYHAKSHIKCWGIILCFVLILVNILNPVYSKAILNLLEPSAITCVLIIWKLSPSSSPNSHQEKEKRKKMKIASVLIAILYVIFSLLFSSFCKQISICFYYSIITTTFLLIIGEVNLCIKP